MGIFFTARNYADVVVVVVVLVVAGVVVVVLVFVIQWIPLLVNLVRTKFQKFFDIHFFKTNFS